MPASWNLPRSSNLWDQQDVEQYTRLPVWMAIQQNKKIPYWSRYQTLLGSINWKPNMGDILQGVIAEPSAVNVQKHTPKNITEIPNKTVVRHFERSNTARVKRHLFESPLFHFLPSFRDFRTKQLKFASDDLQRQVGIGNDNFLRWQILQQAKHVYVVGNATAGEKSILNAVFGEATDTSEPKDAAWFAAMGQKVGPAMGGYLDFRQMCAVRQVARDVIGMVPWEGMKASPKENETVKGKFVMMGESGIYEGLSFDEHVLNFKDYAMNLLNSEFSGVISGNIAFMQERYPLRFLDDGTFPAPEIEVALPATTYGSQMQFETVPNPDYTNAPFGIAIWFGYQPFETLKIGPPPSEFATNSITMGKFRKLVWNGEVRITDDVLVNYGNNNLDTNKYGEYLQLICDTTMGIIPNTPRFVLPIIYRRNLTPSLSVTV